MRLGVLVLPNLTSSRFPLYLTWLTLRYRGVTVTRTFHNKGSTNGNNGVSISFKIRPMVPLFSSHGFPRYHIDHLEV